MVIAGLIFLLAAALAAVAGLRNRRVTSGHDAPIRQAVAPTQLAGAVMLAAGGVAALFAPGSAAWIVLIVCAIGAVGTIAAGSWRGARIAVTEPQSGGDGCSGGGCGGCGQICG